MPREGGGEVFFDAREDAGDDGITDPVKDPELKEVPDSASESDEEEEFVREESEGGGGESDEGRPDFLKEAAATCLPNHQEHWSSLEDYVLDEQSRQVAESDAKDLGLAEEELGKMDVPGAPPDPKRTKGCEQIRHQDSRFPRRLVLQRRRLYWLLEDVVCGERVRLPADKYPADADVRLLYQKGYGALVSLTEPEPGGKLGSGSRICKDTFVKEFLTTSLWAAPGGEVFVQQRLCDQALKRTWLGDIRREADARFLKVLGEERAQIPVKDFRRQIGASLSRSWPALDPLPDSLRRPSALREVETLAIPRRTQELLGVHRETEGVGQRSRHIRYRPSHPVPRHASRPWPVDVWRGCGHSRGRRLLPRVEV
jgi:hypothetical protein